MTTNSSPAQKLATANKSLRNWLIGFMISALVTVASIAATSQPHVLASAVMVFAVCMVILKVDQREKAMLVPIRVSADG